MIHVLFVCLGNICRSPMGEAIFREQVKKAGLSDQIIIDSAGTGDWHIGEVPHKGTQEILMKNAISFENMYARQVQASDFTDFTYIFTMDEKNTADLETFRDGKKIDGLQYKGRILDFVDTSYTGDIPDPYFTGNFQLVYDILTEASQKALEKIKEEHQL